MIDTSITKKVNIKEGSWGNVDITKIGNNYELRHSGELWHNYNTKTMREFYEQYSSYDLAYGDVLLSGFGFGHTANWIASKPNVKSVTIVEISEDLVNAYLSSNSMPDKVSVVISDINSFTTNNKYDCIIFDHFNLLKPQKFYQDMCGIAKKINHDLFWFWSLEPYYLHYNYGITIEDLILKPIDFNNFDFSLKWKDLSSDLNINTIPTLNKNKIDSYINTYFLRHLIQ